MSAEQERANNEAMAPALTMMSNEEAVALAFAELKSARNNWPAFNSAHEGWGVLSEEMDELWDHVKTNQRRRDLRAMRKEAIQVAAMALRFAVEVTNDIVGRR
jgi:hypothetical protein